MSFLSSCQCWDGSDRKEGVEVECTVTICLYVCNGVVDVCRRIKDKKEKDRESERKRKRCKVKEKRERERQRDLYKYEKCIHINI